MNFLKISVLLLIAFSSCAQTKNGNEKAIELNEAAMQLMRFKQSEDSCKKALALLNKATILYPDYYLGHSNKLVFFSALKDFNSAAKTSDTLLKLRPNANDVYLMSGMLNTVIGDTLKAGKLFSKSLQICNQVLDTMNKAHNDYRMLVGNKLLNLYMLGRIKELEILSDSSREMKSLTNVLFKKSRFELANSFVGN